MIFFSLVIVRMWNIIHIYMKCVNQLCYRKASRPTVNYQQLRCGESKVILDFPPCVVSAPQPPCCSKLHCVTYLQNVTRYTCENKRSMATSICVDPPETMSRENNKLQQNTYIMREVILKVHKEERNTHSCDLKNKKKQPSRRMRKKPGSGLLTGKWECSGDRSPGATDLGDAPERARRSGYAHRVSSGHWLLPSTCLQRFKYLKFNSFEKHFEFKFAMSHRALISQSNSNGDGWLSGVAARSGAPGGQHPGGSTRVAAPAAGEQRSTPVQAQHARSRLGGAVLQASITRTKPSFYLQKI